MKIIYKLLITVFTIILFASCTSGPSIQQYFVDNQDNKNFVLLDLPASLVTLKDYASLEAQETLASIKKMNVLAFVKNDSNEALFKEENKKAKSIIKDIKYVELISFRDKGRNVTIRYEGSENDDTIDEIVVFASDKSKGFALIRVLGDEMQPAKILKMMNEIGNIDNDSFKDLTDFAKKIK